MQDADQRIDVFLGEFVVDESMVWLLASFGVRAHGISPGRSASHFAIMLVNQPRKTPR